MSHSPTVDTQEPWYRNPWVWLIIAIPAMTVAGCLLTIYLAITHPHILVSAGSSDAPAATASSTSTGQE